MDTKVFQTRHEFNAIPNIPKGKEYIIGVDVGYSGTKVFFEKGNFCFPSYVRRTDREPEIGSEKDILYRDLDTGQMYRVGYSAQKMNGLAETNDSESEMFSRKRYSNRKFKILCQVAVAMAMQKKEDDRELFIATGLPADYVAADTPAMVKVFSKPARFAIKVGLHPWQEITFTIKKENIQVISQPAGSLYSVLINANGTYAKHAKDVLFSNTLILDIGFGTLDLYGIKGRSVSCIDSFDSCGMRAVHKKVSEMILQETGDDIRIPALQQVLEDGYFTHIDEDSEDVSWEKIPVSEYLAQASRIVFRDAMEQVKGATRAFRDYKYLVVTGGTGEAWYGEIKDYLSKASGLTIYPGNLIDGQEMIYSNVRGYYMYRYMSSKKR